MERLALQEIVNWNLSEQRTTLNSYNRGSKISDIPLYAFASYLKSLPMGEQTII